MLDFAIKLKELTIYIPVQDHRYFEYERSKIQ